MRTLAIDCATPACSVALLDANTLIAGECTILGRGHAERLVPMIAALPGRGQADRIAVSLGPGSFTGVRIGLAAARALALAWNVPAVGFPTLALVAAMAQDITSPQPVSIAMTAGHGQWFIQNFDENGMPLSPLASLNPQDAVSVATASLVAGSEAKALIATRGSGTALPLLPDARDFSLLTADHLETAHAPLYGREPDATLPGGIKKLTAQS